MRQVLLKNRLAIRNGLLSGLMVAAFGIASLGGHLLAQSGQDCDDNAVIRCGVTDLNNLKQKYRENQQGNVQAVFSAFGINNEAALNGMVEGSVTGKNQVFVGNQLVANNAMTAGRQNISNERGSSLDMGGGFWQRPPSVSFANPNGSLRALVKMEGGTFKYAVILSCGNPVGATPVVTPPPPPPPTSSNFEITKDVRIKGQTAWVQHVTAKAEDTLQFRITIRNTGQSDLQNVVLRDVAPSGSDYVEQSLSVSGNATEFFGSGINIGTIARGQHKEVTFDVKLPKGTDTNTCATTRYRNVAFAKHGNTPEKQDDATADVLCKPAVTPQTVTPTQVVLAATTPTPVPETKPIIPVTGTAANLFGIFTATTIGGSLAHRVFMRRMRGW